MIELNGWWIIGTLECIRFEMVYNLLRKYQQTYNVTYKDDMEYTEFLFYHLLFISPINIKF